MMGVAPVVVVVVAVAVEGPPLTTMEANTVVSAIPVNPEAMKALVVKVGMPVHAMPVSLGMAALCIRRRLGAEHDTYQQ